MQPYLKHGRPVPCVYEGDLNELLNRGGIGDIFEHVYKWLNRAAGDDLIDFEQGWEPMRRDAFIMPHFITADIENLQSLPDRGRLIRHCFFRLHYRKFRMSGRSIVNAHMMGYPVTLYEKAAGNFFREDLVLREPEVHCGEVPALMAWPGNTSSGERFITNKYLPEAVGCARDLFDRAELYGCKEELEKGVYLLQRRLQGHPGDISFPLVIILAARRPCRLIGSESRIELCPYIVPASTRDLLPNDAEVLPVGLRHSISRKLLKRMSGISDMEDSPSWSLWGAGSLGSKLALHLARSGNAPDTVVDSACLSAHNLARHALTSQDGVIGLPKSLVLCHALQGLESTVMSHTEDIGQTLSGGKGANSLWQQDTSFVINATASFTVSQAIAASEVRLPRMIETMLLANGQIGVMTIESSERSPSAADLMAECRVLMGKQPDLAKKIAVGNDPENVEIGQGCESETVRMTDGRISLFAAGMSEYLLMFMREGMPGEDGKVLIGQLAEDKVGVQWREHSVQPPKTIPAPFAPGVEKDRSSSSWKTRISARAMDKMRREIARYPQLETGGALMGKIDEASRTFCVADVIEVPDGTPRSATEFVLKLKEIWPLVKEHQRNSGKSFTFLGTWHSHTADRGPSLTDYETAQALAADSLTMLLYLVVAPEKTYAFCTDIEEGRPL